MSDPKSGMHIVSTKAPTTPSFEDVVKNDSNLTAFVMAQLKKMGVDGLSMNSLGTILSKMTFDGTQNAVVLENIVRDAAKTHYEEMKVELLRQSLGSAVGIIKPN